MIRYHRHPELRLTALEGEGVVLHMGSRRYFTVTETGLTILEAVVEPRTFEEIVTSVTNEYEVEQEKAAASVRAFLDRCVDASLVNTVGD